MQLGCNFAVTCHQELSELLAVFGLKSQPESASFSFIYRITEVPLSCIYWCIQCLVKFCNKNEK